MRSISLPVPVALLSFESAIKLIGIEPVIESFSRLGYAPSVATGIGLLEIACTDVGTLLWAGLLLRDTRLRALIPLRG